MDDQSVARLTSSFVVVSHFLYTSGILCALISLCIIFCLGILCGCSHAGLETSKVCPVLYLRLPHLYGVFWDTQWTLGASEEHVSGRTHAVYNNLPGFHVCDTLFDVYQRWPQGACPRFDLLGCTTGDTYVVPRELPAWWNNGTEHGYACHVHHTTTSLQRLFQTSNHVYDGLFQLLYTVVVMKAVEKGAARSSLVNVFQCVEAAVLP